MKKLAVIGANEFQYPLILKARERGYETHVFAWREGAVGAEIADYFYPVSITEIDEIVRECRRIGIDGVASIGSDLANITVAKVAEELGLPGNTISCIEKSTNKGAMRKAFAENGVKVPFFKVVSSAAEALGSVAEYPVIVKPTDRSGSRAITKVERSEDLAEAVERAREQSFENKAIVEAFINGGEYSMELISFKGQHTCLAITKKYTTGAPDYIEVGHLEPAPLDEETAEKCRNEIKKALDALEITNGASHAEFRLNDQGEVSIIEIGSRMGGDCIGSDLVYLSTGCDFVGMVLDCAMGTEPDRGSHGKEQLAAIRFLMRPDDLKRLHWIEDNYPEHLVKKMVEEPCDFDHITDSGSRPGFYILTADTMEEMNHLLHYKDFSQIVPLCETPVHKVRVSDLPDVDIYMKRDDLLPFSFGGNKVRFAVEFLKDMEEKCCDAMVIYGNFHSNLCRILSTVCKAADMPCYMIHMTEDISEETDSGNAAIIRRMNVREWRCGKKNLASTVQAAIDDLTERGYRPYYIYGNCFGAGRETVPMRSYVKVYEELKKQADVTADYIFLGSGTNATQSGLLAGQILQGGCETIVGISTSRNAARAGEVIEENVRNYLAERGVPAPEDLKARIHVEDRYMAGGYGCYDEGILETIRYMYDENGIALDGTYTGKAFRGMISYLKEHDIKDKKILFIHTGGTPLFFDDISNLMGKQENK